MGIEIERKFLLATDAWRDDVTSSQRLIQGYVSRSERTAVRVRIDGERAELNIKHTVDGINRLEFEYPIPLDDARELLDKVALRPLIDKTRHHVRHGGLLWEIDEFHGDNAGLVVAEVELETQDQAFERPAWLGEEVSDDPRYYNSNLSQLPFSRW
ncbi:MAG: CYTH domain-containing protein [Gammaproteobacteria bacterium]|nr:CYTH domain-containing protein [Gammaproteobacteria bacterium]